MACIKSACSYTLPSKRVISDYEQYMTPGWNVIAEEKHETAREAYLEWVFAGRPRQGPVFLLMQKTHAAFKLSLRCCKQHQQEIQADYLAKSLLDKQFDRFWNSIRKTNNSKVSVADNTN